MFFFHRDVENVFEINIKIIFRPTQIFALAAILLFIGIVLFGVHMMSMEKGVPSKWIASIVSIHIDLRTKR